jgi:probable phosphoglycerate mutase
VSAPEGPRLLFLVRHGEADQASDDMRPTPRGLQWDPPLSARGREQAELLARRLLLMEPRPAAVYCSPFRRARETVAPFAETAGVEVALDEDLGEAYVGEWENRSFEEILATDEDLLRRFRDQEPMWSLAPGAEPTDALRERVVRAVERILARHPEGNVLIVAHGGVINAYVGHVLGLEQEMFFLPDHASLSSLFVEGDRRRVRFLNDVRHLTDPHLFRIGAPAVEAPATGGPRDGSAG